MEAIDTATARKRLSELVSRVLYAKERITLTRYGKACAVLVPIEEVEGAAAEKRAKPARKRKRST
jgi:prevent-host-death family protein